jgi:hypothetical protein
MCAAPCGGNRCAAISTSLALGIRLKTRPELFADGRVERKDILVLGRQDDSLGAAIDMLSKPEDATMTVARSNSAGMKKPTVDAHQRLASCLADVAPAASLIEGSDVTVGRVRVTDDQAQAR